MHARSLTRAAMGLLSRSWAEQGIEDLDRWMDYIADGRPSITGHHVSEKSALQYPALWACVNLISSTGSTLPCHVYRDMGNGDAEVAKSHYLYSIIHDVANPTLPAVEWKRLTLAHLLTWGNAYSWIEWGVNNRPKALWIVPPDKVRVERPELTGKIRYYIFSKDGEWVEFSSDDILHIRGLGFDGTVGYSPVGMMRNLMGLAVAAEGSAAALYRNGITSRLVFSAPGVMRPEQQEEFLRGMQSLYATDQNKYKAILVQGGMTATPISINPHDAEFLAQWARTDMKIYQTFGVPPHMVGEVSGSTSWGSGIEQQKDGFLNFTQLPWMKLIETWMTYKLLPGPPYPHYVEHDFKGLMRADTAARAQWHRTMTEIGAYSPNRVLRAENERPYEGGDVYRRPLNTAFVDETGKVVAFTPPGGGTTEEPNEETKAAT